MSEENNLPQEQQHGIKETLDVVILFKDAAEAIRKAKADGEINWKDIPKIAGLIVSVKNAIQGSDQIKAEMGELSKEEAEELGAALVAAATDLVLSIIE